MRLAMCERSTAYLSGIQVTTNSFRLFNRFQLPCNSFQCSECSPHKTKELRARIFGGEMVASLDKVGKYGVKHVTLTAPGNPWRQQHDPQQILKIMQINFNKLMTALRKYYGKLYYLRVTEPHKDGVPHFHVLFVSPAIHSKGFGSHIESLWSKRYKMGFIKPKLIRGLEHGIYYITKYLTKGIKSIKKYQRIFSTGRNTLEMKKKKLTKWIKRNMVFGMVDESGHIYEKTFDDELMRHMDELLKYNNHIDVDILEKIIKHEGRKIP
jgi:hypothetical protein